MKNKPYYNLLLDQNIVIDGHFKLNAGNHADTYIQKDKILHKNITREVTTKLLTNICKIILTNINYNDFVITGPAIAGAMFALPVADKLKLQFAYCEKKIIKYIDNNGDKQDKTIMHFRPDHAKFIYSKKVIIIEDIITTGRNIIKTISAIEKCNAEAFAVVYIWNRGDWQFKPEGYLSKKRFNGIIDKNVDSWLPEECEKCKHNIPLTQLK